MFPELPSYLFVLVSLKGSETTDLTIYCLDCPMWAPGRSVREVLVFAPSSRLPGSNFGTGFIQEPLITSENTLLPRRLGSEIGQISELKVENKRARVHIA